MLMILSEISLLIVSVLLYRYMGTHVSMPYQSLLNLGFIILIAIFTGRVFKRLHLPVITGYMVAGLIVSPYSFGLSPIEYIREFKLIDYFAITFIGMQAGSEMSLKLLRRDFRKILLLAILIITISSLGTFFVMFMMRGFINSFLNIGSRVIFVLMFLAVFEIAKSPVTTIAIINESNVRNRFSYTILGITIIKDVILVFLFAIVLAVVELILASHAVLTWNHFIPVAMELFGSMILGFVIALIFIVYMKMVNFDTALIILIFAFLISFIGDTIHINPLITGISAGFLIENYSDRQKQFSNILSSLSPYIYVLFFPMASAVLDISVIPSVILIVLILLMLRKLFLFTSFGIAYKLTDMDSFTLKYGWMGLINQSGITLALAILIQQTMYRFDMPHVGDYIKTIAIASIIITDFYGPPLFKLAVMRSKKYFNEKLN